MSDVVKRGTVAPARPDSEAPRGTREFLGFRVAGEAYALPLESVREILKPPPVTPVPRSHHEVLGIITVRGVITTVLCLRRRLRLEDVIGPIMDPAAVLEGAGRPLTGQELREHMRRRVEAALRQRRILLVDSGKEVIGVLVDEVRQVHRLEDDEVELAQSMGSDLSEHVLGIGRPRESARDAGDAQSVLEREASRRKAAEVIVLLDPGPLLSRKDHR